MTLRHYTALRLIVAILLSSFIAISVSSGSYLWPIVAMAAAMTLLLLARHYVREIIADERDYALGGFAARWAIQIFSLVTVILMFVLLSLKEQYANAEIVASVLGYTTCALMLLYAVIFRLFRSRNSLRA